MSNKSWGSPGVRISLVTPGAAASGGAAVVGALGVDAARVGQAGVEGALADAVALLVSRVTRLSDFCH